MTTVRKLLLAVLLVSLAGSAFGAGTFASFNASVTNAASTFQTGSVVLTQNDATNTCYSTGNSVAGANGGVTDTNANAACAIAFTGSIAKPNDTATQALTLRNDGTVNATSGIKAYSTSNCIDANSTASNSYFGTGSLCDTLQLKLDNSTVCIFGGGYSGEIKGTSAQPLSTNSATLTFTVANNTIIAGANTATITAGTYGFTTATSLAQAIQSALDAATPAAIPYIAGVGTDGAVYLANKTAGGALPTLTSGTALATLGLSTTSTVFAATQAASCAYDPAFTVASFRRLYTSSSAGLTVVASLNAATNQTVNIGLHVDTNAGNVFQGRKATFSLTWFLA